MNTHRYYKRKWCENISQFLLCKLTPPHILYNINEKTAKQFEKNEKKYLQSIDEFCEIMNDVKTEWFLWLRKYKWNLWGTFTFKYPVLRGDSAIRYFSSFWRRIPECVGYMAVVENFKWIPNGVHIHALLYCIGESCADLEIRSIWRRWFDRYGRNQIKFLWKEADGVYTYVSKYVTKQMVDWKFFYDEKRNV